MLFDAGVGKLFGDGMGNFFGETLGNYFVEGMGNFLDIYKSPEHYNCWHFRKCPVYISPHGSF